MIQSSEEVNVEQEENRKLRVLLACTELEEDSLDRIKNIEVDAERFILSNKMTNPEDIFTAVNLKPAMDYAFENNFDIVVALDSTVNKLAIAVRKYVNGSLVLLNVHQISMLVSALLLQNHENLACIKSVFITDILDKIFANANRAFRSVAELKSPLREESKFNSSGVDDVLIISENHEILLLGQHDSLSYLISRLLIAAKQHLSKDLTLFDFLMDLYFEHGFKKEKLVTSDISSVSQKKFFDSLITTLRKKTPDRMGGSKIIQVMDFKNGTLKNMISGRISPINLPEMEALKIKLESGVEFLLAPRGDKVFLMLEARGGIADKEEYTKINRAYDEKMTSFLSNFNKLV